MQDFLNKWQSLMIMMMTMHLLYVYYVPDLIPNVLLLLINPCYVVNTYITISIMSMRNWECEIIMPLSSRYFLVKNFQDKDSSTSHARIPHKSLAKLWTDWLMFNCLQVKSQSLGAEQSSLAWTVVGQASWLIYLVHPLNSLMWIVLTLFVCLFCLFFIVSS